VRDVYHGVVTIFAGHARSILAAAVIVFVPLGLLDAADHTMESIDFTDVDTLGALAILGGVLVHVGSVLLGEVFYSGVVTAIVTETRGGEGHTLQAVARSLPYATLIAVDILTVLIVGVGFVALIVPGILLTVWLAPAAPVAELERRGAIASLRRSRDIVRGHFWTAFWVVMPVLILNDALSTLLESAKASVLGESFIADWAGATLSDVATSPIYALALVVLTLELRERRDAESAKPSAD
jgi:hypothetical protein